MSIQAQISSNGCYHLVLNRALKSNALDRGMIQALNHHLDLVSNNKDIKMLFISGHGKNFCTGVDLNWMQQCGQLPEKENLKYAECIASVLKKLYALKIPKIAKIQGRVMGGAVGLVSCCNVVLAHPNTQFCLPEIRLAIIPAIILPYLMEVIGKKKAMAYSLLATPWSAQSALHDGLVDYIVQHENFENECEKIVQQILSYDGYALDQLFLAINSTPPQNSFCEFNPAKCLAELRSRSIAQTSFSEKL